MRFALAPRRDEDKSLSLKLYNTLSRKKEIFRPIDPENVRMYVCGPTVYDHAHIGNARPIIVFDVLYRLLRHLYGETHVTYVRNITDVDDKINARAAQEGVSIGEITARTTKQFHEDIKALGVLPPDEEPRATEHIEGMIAMIKTLIERGHAYEADGHVLFSVSSDKSYGCLSNRSPDEMRAGARVDVALYKKDPMDFVLWKPSKPELPGWDSPWGRGRPGWHIECSVMSEKYLGKTFDIHGGGADLIFPHHENEIAQSTCAHGNARMANYFVHNGYLQVEGEKMSKSLGNFITIHDLLHTENFGGRKWPGEVLRLAMLSTHYRKSIDFSVTGLENAEKKLAGWYQLIGDVNSFYMLGKERIEASDWQHDVVDALRNDLNTHDAITILDTATDFSEDATDFSEDERDNYWAERFKMAANVLGLLQGTESEWKAQFRKEVKLSDDQIHSFISHRNAARAAKNWAEADRIRDELDAMGIELKDGPEGTTWGVKR